MDSSKQKETKKNNKKQAQKVFKKKSEKKVHPVGIEPTPTKLTRT